MIEFPLAAKSRKIIGYFLKTLAFYSEVTGYSFPVKPILRMFIDHEEFLRYISQPSEFSNLSAEKCGGAAAMFFGNRIVIAVDLTLEEEYPKLMWAYTFFHEYEHIRRNVNKQGMLRIFPEDPREELETCIAAINLTEKFLGFRFPSDVKKDMKKRLIEAHVQGLL